MVSGELLMPLRCRNPFINQDVHAFDLSAGEWRSLADENRKSRHLRLPCCAADVVLKTSQRSVQFFAHKAKGSCWTAPETEAHLRLKQLAITAARANGWSAAAEVRGSTPDGEPWIADAFARKGAHKVAVEIQWSGQTNDETLARQARYARSGVRGLWLLRQPGFPIGRHLPAARVTGTAGDGYRAVLPNNGHAQEVPMTEFLDAAFGGRLKFRMPKGFAAHVALWGNEAECWSCHRSARVITSIAVAYGPFSCQFSIPEITNFPAVFEIVRGRLPPTFAGVAIKPRYSKTQERTYLSNGCIHCDALFGQFFESNYYDDMMKICEFLTPANDAWCHVIADQCEEISRWGVYQYA
jgi:hypothetical protein